MKRQRCVFPMAGSFQNATGVPPWKRLLDIMCIMVASPLVVPTMLAIAVVIKAVSPGPVFFRQERVGLRRQKFNCLKFRTMKPGAPTCNHQTHLIELMKSSKPMTKLDGADDRLIPFGRVLRATGLDELPQLINVWIGEMSVVGPRPCTTYELQGYQERHYGRFETLPGLTGLWQVSGKNETTFEQMIDLDIHYVKQQSAWLDVKIMVKTPVVLMWQCMEALGGKKGFLKRGPRTETMTASA